MKIVAISGSLRSASHNTAVLEAIRRLAPPDVAVGLFDGIGKLPFFNSDIEAENLPRSRRVSANYRRRALPFRER
jgi:chromate reductase, NAD(P)H dehydrogenase (quinone)